MRFLPQIIMLSLALSPVTALAATYTVTNTSDSGAGSLRQAILDANGNSGADIIEFSIGTGVQTIAPTSALPPIIDPVTIDGLTQPGGAASGATPDLHTLLIVLDGSSAGGNVDAMHITGGSTTIRGLVINNWNPFGFHAIRLDTAGGNTVEDCFIGTNDAGSVDAGNGTAGVFIVSTSPNNTIDACLISGNGGCGINLMSTGNTVTNCFIGTNKAGTAAITNDVAGIILSSDNNTIGGSGNLISGNTTHGIEISGGDNTTVKGNKIGTDINGTAAIANGSDGINVIGMNNTVGGTNASDRNIISGNTSDGIGITGASSTGNLVEGNYIGLGADGATIIGNLNTGVTIDSGASANTIGGSTSSSRNVISGNGSAGVYIDGTNNVVQGNFIGTDATGTLDRGNSGEGVGILDSNNTIGGTASGEGNVISGNGGAGVCIDASTNNIVQGNLIGTQADGVSALGNADEGVEISGDDNTIGGTTPGAGNTIAFNSTVGVAVGNGGTGNAILSNSIFSNTQLGINLDFAGVTGNDVDDVDTGDNNLQNFPLLGTAYTLLGGVGVQGSLNSVGATTYRIEFFGNTAADPTGNGEGETFLGFTSVTTSSTVSFTVGLPGTAVPIGNFITATATDPNNNTSEFSDTLTVQFGVSAVSPVLHDIDGSAAANLTATFSDNMLIGAAGTYVVHGSQTGNRTGSGAYGGGGSTALSFNPTTDFNAGEEVEVTLTTGLQNTSVVALPASLVWKFLAAAGAGGDLSQLGTVGNTNDFANTVKFGDMNGDGNLDLVLGNNGTNDQNEVHINNGSGGLATSVNVGPGTDETVTIALGDLDGDGDLDVVVGNQGAGTQNVAYFNDGNATPGFATSVNFGPGNDRTQEIKLGDMDGDGDLDLVVGNAAGEQNVVYFNDGTGPPPAFGVSSNFGTAGNSYGIGVGDFDNNGTLDIAVGNRGGQNVVHLNDGTGTFVADVNFGTGTENTEDLAVGDMDGDGDLDIICGNAGPQNVVYLNDGNPTPGFGTSVNFGTGTDFTTAIAVGDMDGDTDLDIVTVNDGEQNAVYFNDGNATPGFGTSKDFGTANSFSITTDLGDVDGDSSLDIVQGGTNAESIVFAKKVAVTVDSTQADPQGVFVRLVAPDSGVTVPIGESITVSVVAFPAVSVDSVLIGLSSDAQVTSFGNLGHLDTLSSPTASTSLADTFRAVFTVAAGDTQMSAPTGIAVARILIEGDSLGFKQLDNQSTFEIIIGSPEFGLVGDQKTFGIDGQRPLATAIDSALLDTAALANTGGSIFGTRATTDGADGANQLIRSFKIGDEVTVKLNVDNANFLFTELDSVFLHVVDAVTLGYQDPDSAFVSVGFSALEVFLQNGGVTHTFTVNDSLFQSAQVDDNVRVEVLAFFRDKAGNLSAATTDAATAAAFTMDILTVADSRPPVLTPIHPAAAGDRFTGRIDTTLTFREDNGTIDNALSLELNPLTLTVDEGTSAILAAVDTDTATFSGADDGDTLSLATVDSFAATIGEAAGAAIDLSLVAIDSVGNPSTVTLSGVILDQVAPVPTNVFPTVAALDTNVINDETRHPRFTVEEPLDSVAVRYIEDITLSPGVIVQSLNATALAAFGENVTVTVTESLKDDTVYTLQILTKDPAGNIAATAIETFTYDASFINPEADSFIVTLDSSATVVDSVIAGVNLPIKITSIDTALSNAEGRLRPAVAFTGEVTIRVQAGEQETGAFSGTGVTDNADGSATLSAEDWFTGARIVSVKSETILDDFSLVVTSSDSTFSGRLDSLTVDAAEFSSYDVMAYEDGAIVDAVSGDFDLTVTPTDAYGNPSTKLFVTPAADLTDADSLIASSNLLTSRIPGSNVLGSVWVEFAANVGDVGLPDGSHKVLPEGTSFTLTAPHRTGSDLIVSVRTTNGPGDTTGVTLPHTIALGRSVPLAFFAEGETPAIVLSPAAPDTFLVTDYRGANNEGDQGGFVIVTFPPSKDGDARDPRVNHYRVYREIAVTVGVNDFGELVETGDTTLAFVSWAVIDSPPEDTLIVAVVPAIDNVETRWGVAGEYGATSGEAGPLAKSSISPTDDVNGDDIRTMLQRFGITNGQFLDVRAYRHTPPSDDPTEPLTVDIVQTFARFDPQPPRITSAKLSSTSMTLSEPARAIDNIPPAPVTNVRITQDGDETTVTWSPSPDDRPVGSIPYRGFAVPIPGVARYRILVGDGATGLASQGTVSPGTVTYAGVLEGSLIRVDAEDLDNVTQGPSVPLGATSFVDADGNPVYIIVFGGNTPLQQDFEDFIEFARSFAASEGDENYNILADIDKDGEIGFADFLTFVQAFNRTAVDPGATVPATRATPPDIRLVEK